MKTVLHRLLRVCLILAVSLSGVMAAHAAVFQAAVLSAGAAQVASDMPPHCHEEEEADKLVSPSLQGKKAPTQECCKGGVCACACAAPATASSTAITLSLPAAGDRAIPRLHYQPSHLLPLPFRPPIA